ncbi:MAG: hypothetical protein JWL59_901 [Chthoniobacteraceae bacterium]|nr:hypothetical protein [Chthoniobacteraceae bacterium]
MASSTSSIAGRILLTLFLAIFLSAGLFFGWLITKTLLIDAAPYWWTKTDAVILESAMREDNSQNADRYEFTVRYQYRWAGETHTDSQFTTGKKRFSDLGEVARFQKLYVAGSRVSCWVDPNPPHRAVLKRANPWMALLLLFPLPFILIGGGGIYRAWRDKGTAVSESIPVSERATKGSSVVFLRLFGLLFLVVGTVLFYVMALQPAWRIMSARKWSATPCQVLSSRVISNRGNKGTTYSVEVRYAYEFGGRKFEANRYGFFTGSTSGYAGKQAVVDRFPPRSQAVCYVNPNDPNEAVIDRGISSQMWFGLLPLAFVVAGGSIIAGAPRMAGRSSSRLRQPQPGIPDSVPAETALPDGPYELKASASPIGRLVGIIFIALFWCGIVSVFVFHVIDGWRRGRTEWFLVIFLIPFVLVGLGLLAAIPYQFLALFNPRVRLLVNSRTVPLGGELRVNWTLSGNARKVRRLRLLLEGREEATYRRGTNTSTDKNVFISLPLLDSTESGAIAAGNANLTIPAGLMHTFVGANNKVLWSLHAKGEILRWPDIADEFEITILPLLPRK